MKKNDTVTFLNEYKLHFWAQPFEEVQSRLSQTTNNFFCSFFSFSFFSAVGIFMFDIPIANLLST